MVIESLNTLAIVLGTVGGFESIKWFFTRKTSKREEKAKAKESEYRVLEAHIKFCEQQLLDQAQQYAEQTRQYAEQTQLVRRLNNELLELERAKAKEILELEQEKSRRVLELERENSELKLEKAVKHCDYVRCPFRFPPTAYTTTGDMTLEEYLRCREKACHDCSNTTCPFRLRSEHGSLTIGGDTADVLCFDREESAASDADSPTSEDMVEECQTT